MLRLACVASVVVGSGCAVHQRVVPVLIEAGINARHFGEATNERPVAARTTSESADTMPAAGAGSVSLRFTQFLRWGAFAGVEAEAGQLAKPGSNLAGAYAVAGARGDVGRITLAAELAGGRRWLRYGLDDENTGMMLVEPRVRADLWISPRVRVGAAIGSTFGDHDALMAGVYVGLHAMKFGRTIDE